MGTLYMSKACFQPGWGEMRLLRGKWVKQLQPAALFGFKLFSPPAFWAYETPRLIL